MSEFSEVLGGPLDDLRKFHQTVVNNMGHQKMVNITVYTTCALLLPLTLIVLIKSLMIKEKLLMLTISFLLLMGEVFGIVGTYYLETLMQIASVWMDLFTTPPELLHRYSNLIIYNFAFFFGSFQVAHWLFAMQYWSLSLRLRHLVSQKDPKELEIIIWVVGVIGLFLNFAGVAFIIIAAHNHGVHWIADITDFMNVFPCFLSLCFMFDAFIRIRKVTNGVFSVQTNQMLIHIWSFAAVTIAGILLSVITHPKVFEGNSVPIYICYEFVMIMVFLAELPFTYIINSVLDMGLNK